MKSKAELEQQQLEWAGQVVHTDDAEPWELRRIGGLDVHWIDDLKGVMLNLCVSWTMAERRAIVVHAAAALEASACHGVHASRSCQASPRCLNRWFHDEKSISKSLSVGSNARLFAVMSHLQ